MIGMNAVVLDDAVVKSNSIVAAGSVVTKGTVVESSVYAGIPAKKDKGNQSELLENEINRIAGSYRNFTQVGIKSSLLRFTFKKF